MIEALHAAFAEAWGWDQTPFRLLHFTTTRMVLGFLTAFLAMIFLGPRAIRALHQRGVRDRPRDYGVTDAGSKRGTPTMGGLILIATLLGSSAIWCNIQARPVALLMMATLFFAGLGALDDAMKLRAKNSDGGLSRGLKMLAQAGFGVLFAVLVLHDATSPFDPAMRTLLHLPGVPNDVLAPPDLGWFYGVFIVFVFLGVSNAINFADGLDGLAVVPSVMTALVFGVYAYMFSHSWFAAKVDYPSVAWMNEVTVFSACFLGGGLGYLWFNAYPAQVFLGDTGSMAIGGALAAMAVLAKAELLFFVAGGLFVYEFLSVLIQDYIGIKRLGRRLFLRAPAHHSWQHRGVSETKVVVRFWIVSFLLAVVSLAALKMR